jgi:PAS domain S-box-containing protein
VEAEAVVTGGAANNSERRVLLVAPTGKDAALTEAILDRIDVPCRRCGDLREVCEELDAGAALVLMMEEALTPDGHRRLVEWLGRQPPWSDLPIVVMARPGAESAAVAQSMDLLGNVTVLERPTRIASLVSAVRTALRARQRQYQMRDDLADRERAVATQALLAAIVASSDDAILSTTLDGKILTWNVGAERLLGYSAEEAIGRSITMLTPPDRDEEPLRLLECLRRGQRVQHYETVRVAKNGRHLDVSLTMSPIIDVNGRILGASKLVRDVSQTKRAEAALREADRRKDEFLAILAHELRNPLAPIRNSLHILRMTWARDAGAARVGEMMERQVSHMVRLVDDLMEVSRITRGKIGLRKEPLAIAAIIDGAVETSRPLIEARGHRLELEIPSEPLALEGDPVRLTQVVANLLNNAAKYTDPGGRIALAVRREGDAVVISVADTGAGIPPDMLHRVFDLFIQGDGNAERVEGGLGIGLTLVKTLVEMHGGTVAAFSEGAGRGSEFVVRLPLSPPAETAGSSARSVASDVVLRRRVLVVDDNRDAADSLGTLLELLGADVRVVYNGPEAIEALDTYHPSVVLLDIGMPGMDGYEVARRIRELSEPHDVTLIALSGWGQEEARQLSQRAGFDYHLVKPADASTLESVLISLEARTGRRPA